MDIEKIGRILTAQLAHTLQKSAANTGVFAATLDAVQRNGGTGAASFAEELESMQKKREFTMSAEEFYKIRYNCACPDGVVVHFPPDDATDEQKLLWCDTVGQMDCEKRAVMLSGIGYALAFGDYWGLTMGQGWADNEGEFENSRMERLGFAGTIELVLRATQHCLKACIDCGNEQRFTDNVKYECDMWQSILNKYMVNATPKEHAQVQEADGIYETTQKQREALEVAGTKLGLIKGDDYDDARLTALLNSFTQTTRHILPDGSTLVTTIRNGRVSSQYREKPSLEDTLLKMLIANPPTVTPSLLR